MKACVLHGIGDIRYQEVPDPVAGEGEVLIKVRASGVCGSDIPRVFAKGTYRFPTIPGHEFAGEVTSVGEGVDGSLIGGAFAVFPMIPCRRCALCLVGDYAKCRDYDYYGSRRDGAFAGMIAVKAWNLVPVPEGLSYEEAAMAEPAAVAIHALRNGGVEAGDSVAIFGAGPIGLMLAEWAKAWGAGKVMLVDVDGSKVAFAKGLGFERAYDGSGGDAVSWVLSETEGMGADLCIEGSGASAALEQCLGSARPSGRVVAMGNPIGEMRLSQKGYWDLLRKELKVSGTWNSGYSDFPRNDWRLSLEYMRSGRLDVRRFITHRADLSEAVGVLGMMRDKKAFFNKVMFVS